MKKTSQKNPMLMLSALAVAVSAAQAQFVPIALAPESYNHDIVVERTTTPPPIPRGFYTTASMDGGIANNGDTWNERGYFSATPDVGLPVAGSTITSLADANHQYTFAADYKELNAFMLDATPYTSATATLTTPTSVTGLSFLTSGGNGGCLIRYTARHQDGTTSTGTTPSADWFNGANPAWIANGRVNAQTYNPNNINSGNPRLYSKDVPITNPSPITSILLEYVSSAANAHTCIMAISGQTAGGAYTPLQVTGYNVDLVVEESAQERTVLTGATTATLDTGTGNTGFTLYEVGYAFNRPATGLPAAGSTLTATTTTPHSYVLAPSYVNANNAMLLGAGSELNGAMIPQTPQAFYGLSFLGLSAGGASPVDYTVTHADGSTQSGQITVRDWFNATPVAYTLAGRVAVNSSVLDAISETNPRLYNADIQLDNITSPVTRIDLGFVGSQTQRAAILAVSGATGPLIPSFLTQPAAAKHNPGETATFTVTASGTAPITFQWQRLVNGEYVNLTDSATVSGSQTATLTLGEVSAADATNYRVIATNGAGSTTSNVTPLTILSALPRITTPTDSITGFGGTWPDGEAPRFAIDGTTSKYLNFGPAGGAASRPVGFVVTPSQGRTILGAVRFYTANDATERDPMSYIIEGSNDGGSTYTVIASGALNLPEDRNDGNQALNPVTHDIQQVLIANTTAYSTYRVSFPTVRAEGGGLFQIGEVEMLGTVDTSGTPFFATQPVSVVGQVGGSVQLTATASGTPTPTIRWYRSVNGGPFVALSDSATVSGSGTDTLTLSGLTLNDSAQFQAVATSTAGTATSSTVNVTVLSNGVDITSPNDIVTVFGDEAGTVHGGAAAGGLIIDNTTSEYINGGSGFSAAAGFPPFGGPAGVVIEPAAGATIVTALRVYTGDANPERDPVSFKLEGSNDAGATYTTIAEGPLTLPTTRTTAGVALDPLTQGVAEARFSNAASYTSYRLSFLDVRSPNEANGVQVAEIELLGTTGESGPQLSITKTGDSITITWAGGGTLEYITDLNQAANPAAWTSTGDSDGSYTQQTTGTMRIFRVRR